MQGALRGTLAFSCMGIGNVLGLFVFLLSLQILLFLASKDEKFSTWKRVCMKILFWHINVCYVAGAIATLLSKFR